MHSTNAIDKAPLLNCDMGESLGEWRMGMDEEVMPLIDLASVACGFHASDPVTMARTVLLAKQAGVRTGAHPSYPDLVGFGRRSMQCSSGEITSLVHYQIGALDGIGRAQGVRVHYVKPHGALYNDMMRDYDILRAILEAVATYGRELPLIVLAREDNSEVHAIAEEFGVPLLLEAFADRAYDHKGLLMPRSSTGSVYHDEAKILAQAMLLAQEGFVETPDGARIPLQADTLCVHGDNVASVQAIKKIRTAFDQYYGAPPA